MTTDVEFILSVEYKIKSCGPSVVSVRLRHSMRSLIILASLAALASARTVQVRSFEYGYCEGAHEPLTFDAISVSPDPLVLATGAEINLHVLVTLLETVNVGAKIKLNMVKEGFIDLPIPCIPIGDINIGSW